MQKTGDDGPQETSCGVLNLQVPSALPASHSPHCTTGTATIGCQGHRVDSPALCLADTKDTLVGSTAQAHRMSAQHAFKQQVQHAGTWMT